LLPQNAMVLKKQGLYDEYTFNKNRKRRRSNKVYNEVTFIDRNWQEFNWIAYQIQEENEKVAP
ncbi:MAG: DUF4173 domain-containing protein, partial [Nonlabens sp.]